MTEPREAGRPAGLGRRGVSALLDALIGLAAVAVCAMWLVLGLWALRGLRRDALEGLVLLVAVIVLAGALHAVYRVAFIGGCGQTPGKMALGIAVVRKDGARAGYGRALLRTLGGALDTLTLGIVSTVLLLGPERRGLADRIAGTRVVLLRRAGAGARGEGQGRLERLQRGQPIVERRMAGK